MKDLTPARWVRLAPWALIYFFVRQVKELAQGMIYAIPALAVSVSVADLFNNTWLVAGIALLIISTVTSAFLRFWFFRYRVHDEQIEIQSGVFAKTHINLPFWRIQNIRIERPWYYRLSTYAVLIIDTAGSATEEATIVAISQTSAIALRDTVKAQYSEESNSRSKDTHCNIYPKQYQDTHATTSPESHSSNTATIINSRSLSDLVLHGVTNNRVWILLGALTPFLDDLSQWGVNWLSQHGIEPEQLIQNMSLPWWQWAALVLTGASSIVVLLMLFSVCGAILSYYGFTLTRDEGRYIRRSGLLSQQEVSIQRSRVQRTTIRQSALDVVAKRANVSFEQNRNGQRDDNEGSAAKLLIPSVTLKQAASLTTDVFSQADSLYVSFRKINTAFLFHHWIVRLLPLAVGVGVLLNARLHSFPTTSFLAGIALVALLIFIRFLRWGYALDQEYLYIRKGLVGKTYHTIPLFKLQQMSMQQSIMMRRKELVHLKVILASGAVDIPFMAHRHAQYIMNYALFKCESDARSWM